VWSETHREQGKPHVPKKEGAIDLIGPRGELAMLTPPQGENRAFSARFLSVRGRI